MSEISLRNRKNNFGFTLLEMVVLVGILVVLLSILFITLNPSRQYQLANEDAAKRNISSLRFALEKWLENNDNDAAKLNYGNGIPSEKAFIGSSGGEVNPCPDIVPDYIDIMPTDPTAPGYYYNTCQDYFSGFMISYTEDPIKEITILSPDSNLSEVITIRD